MANENYESDRISIQNSDRWHELESWNQFQKEKKAIQDKYPSRPWDTQPITGPGNSKNIPEEGWWEEWCSYKKEITDLMLNTNGSFSEFLYEIRPEKKDIETRIWLRGRYNTEKYNRKPNEK
jgi:hypothetical protein